MRKYFLSFVALAAGLFATSCQESIIEPQIAGPTTFTVQLPDQMGTKAFGDQTSTNATIDSLFVEVYSADGNTLIYEPAKAIKVEEGKATFTANLIQDQKYDIIFWAQKGNAYNTSDLRSIPMENRAHNVDDGAAFFAFLNDFVPAGASQSVVLRRPFAQLNLGTTDESLVTNAGTVKLSQSSIQVEKVAATFNTVLGVGEGEQTVQFALANVPTIKLNVGGVEYNYVSMDYLPIAGDDQALVNVNAQITLDNGQVIDHTFTSVPVRENYRTNIVGNLISSTTDFNITIEEGFVEDESDTDDIVSNEYLVVDNVADANTALNNDADHIAINMIESVTSVLNLNNSSKETLYIQLPDADATLKIEGTTVKNLYISVPNTTSGNPGFDLTINTPNAHVELNGYGNSFRRLVTTTSSNTLVLSGVVVEEVVVEQGNVVVENESTVGEIEPGDNVNPNEITIYVDDASTVTDVNDAFENVIQEGDGDIKFITSVAKLQELAELVNGGNNFAGQTITLLADIDLNNVEWTSIGTEDNYFAGTFEGNGHTIKNLTVVETEAKEGKAFIGFFGYAKNATIKNLTFENVYLNIACLDIDHSQGHIGAVAGSLEGTSTIENVTVKGDIKVESTVTANGASRVAVVAGGNSYGNVTMKNVHVIANEGSYLKANNNVGALAGQLQGKSVFEDCSSNIDVTGTKFFAGGIIGLAAGDQTFTNCHTTGDITITAGREGRAHDQYRVGGIAGGWSDGAKNVCTLTGCSYTGEVSGKNSDGSVANPLDYAGYVGRGYTLNGCQGSKVVINGVEYVQAFNTAAEAGIYYINGVWTINSAAEFKMLADKVNGGIDYFEGKTIKLGADIDLNNEEWIPIGSATKDHGFMGNFDGNGKTIKNLKITKLTPDTDNYVYAGLFGVTEGTDADNQNYIKNLVIENVTIETTGHIAAAAIAYPYYTQVENITVKGNISIKGGDYTSGVLAYTRRCVDAKNLTIQGNEGSSIEGNQTVGGVISDIQTNGGLIVNYSNFKAAGLTISAEKSVGGISGIISEQTLDVATVENVTIICDDLRKGIVSGALGGESTIKNIQYKNVFGAENIVGATYDDSNDVIAKGDVYFGVTYTEVSSADGLIAALEASENVAFKNDIKIDPATMGTNYGKTGINVMNGQTINGNGYTLNIQGAGGTWDSGINTTGGLIKDITVTGSFRGIFINHNSTHSERVVLENVTIDGTTYTISCDQGVNQGFTAIKSTFNGWTSYAATIGDVKFVDCSFGEGQGNSFCRPYAPTEFVNCAFEAGYQLDPRAAVTFENCTIGGVALTAQNIATLVTSNIANATVK